MEDETGMGTVEIILIIVVLVGLVIIFRQQLNDLVQRIFGKITSDSSTIIG
jgi:Flp pilus assembly pilin Flp